MPDSLQMCLSPDIWRGDAPEHAAAAAKIRACSAVVGMHPDQATDSIVELAAELGKPFALVPCCVFPRLFNHRRLPDSDAEEPGAPVVTTEQLIRYLMHYADTKVRRACTHSHVSERARTSALTTAEHAPLDPRAVQGTRPQSAAVRGDVPALRGRQRRRVSQARCQYWGRRRRCRVHDHGCERHVAS